MSRPPGLKTAGEMTRPLNLVWLMLCSFFLLVAPPVTAGACRYGSVQAWSYYSEGVWVTATAHPVLKRGEVFRICVQITVTTALQVVYVKLHEFGTPVYEVLDGPSQMEQLLECRQCIHENQTVSYQWMLRVRPETTWVNGVAPLEVFVQFTRDDDDCGVVDFDVVTALIVDQMWDGSSHNQTQEGLPPETNDGNHMAGFDGTEIIAVVVLLSVLMRIKKRWFT